MSALPDSTIISYPQKDTIDPWLIWFVFFSALLVFISLFLVSSLPWHITVLTITLIVLWKNSTSPAKTLAGIIGLVVFLAVLQILFSPFMRDLFLRSLDEGFVFSDWQYLLFTVERFAWPLVIVSSFQSRLTNPAVLAEMTALLSPLKWLGLQIGKLQTLVILALRFIPALKVEWERFSKFQTYFASRIPRRTLTQRISFWMGTFKALISHTIHRSILVGDLLAMRGLPSTSIRQRSPWMMGLLSIWLGLGGLSAILDKALLIIWGLMTLWLLLVSVASREGSKI